METGFLNSSSGGHDGVASTVHSRGQNSNFTNSTTWDNNNNWDNNIITTTTIGTATAATRFYNWTNPVSSVTTTTVATEETSLVHALLFNSTPGVRSTCMADPNMMCLKLGKRHYYEDMTGESLNVARRSKQYPFHYPNPYCNSSDTRSGVRVVSSGSVVARCQVEGCHVALGNAKEYYRKHKVCEIHSKAPKVVVSGLQQRFCQQCSRFHGVTEFDEAKRSCRRRLKGHNQRRRKGTHSMMEQRLGPSTPGCALSLLSSPETQPWNPSGDLSSRCSAALYELIAANRATSSSVLLDQSVALGDTQMWDDTATTTTTGEVKQGPALEIGLLSMKAKDPEAEEWTDYCWSSFGGANLM